MGLYHSVNVVYGFEIPAQTDVNEIDHALRNQPYNPDSVGYIVVGDCDRLLLATRCVRVDELAVISLTPEFFTPPGLSDWGVALHEAAVRIGCPNHPTPTWLVIHNYR